VVSGVGTRKCVLDGHAHWRHMANTVERLHMVAMSGSANSGGNVAFSQIIVGDFVSHSGLAKSSVFLPPFFSRALLQICSQYIFIVNTGWHIKPDYCPH